jgi:hypothetical protein
MSMVGDHVCKASCAETELLDELQKDNLGPEERDQVERLLEQINAALDSLGGADTANN